MSSACLASSNRRAARGRTTGGMFAIPGRRGSCWPYSGTRPLQRGCATAGSRLRPESVPRQPLVPSPWPGPPAISGSVSATSTNSRTSTPVMLTYTPPVACTPLPNELVGDAGQDEQHQQDDLLEGRGCLRHRHHLSRAAPCRSAHPDRTQRRNVLGQTRARCVTGGHPSGDRLCRSSRPAGSTSCQWQDS
jgi:hypothetical protein